MNLLKENGSDCERCLYGKYIYLNTSFKPVLSLLFDNFFLISHIEIVHTKTYTQKVCDCVLKDIFIMAKVTIENTLNVASTGKFGYKTVKNNE